MKKPFRITVIPILLILVILAYDTLNPKSEKYTEMREMMGTVARIDTCLDQKTKPLYEAAYRGVWNRLTEINWRMNVYDDKSDNYRVSQSYDQPVQVLDDTYFILEKAKEYHERSEGAFEVTIWPLMKVWKQAQEDGVLPEETQIEEAKAIVGSQYIRLLPNRKVQLEKRGMSIDFGGIAAGYALDEAARIFREHGVEDFFVDIGGDIYAGGKNCDNRKWRVGVRNPQDPSELIEVLYLSDQAVTTSGNTERYFEIQGQRFSHIIDPRTGWPQKDVTVTTVIAPTGIDADALATAACVLGQEKGTAMINEWGKGYASVSLSLNSGLGVERTESQYFKNFLKDR